MTWEIWKGFIIGNVWIIFWVAFAFVAMVFYHQIRFKAGKEYLKSVGMSFVDVPMVFVRIVQAIFNFKQVE